VSASNPHEVDVDSIALARLADVLGPVRAEHFGRVAEQARARLLGRRVVNVNSTATGGGVAELLQTLLAYAKGAGIDARWIVVEGDAEFFRITKRIHNHLYGTAGDGGPLGASERGHYEAIAAQNFARLRSSASPGDIVGLHDPQTAGLARGFVAAGARVVWRCHVGIDTQNACSQEAWEFLRPYVEDVEAFVFSRAEFAPTWIPRKCLAVIPPSIDPFSSKNEMIESHDVTRLLQQVGLLAGSGAGEPVSFRRRDGSQGLVVRPTDMLGTGPPPQPYDPMVLQVSRWDSMKDMLGVMTGFADSVAPHNGAHLVLAGPESSGVADDPEADDVLRDCIEAWARMPAALQARVHLASVPMTDGDEAATTVNALQRHAAVVVQKSLAEGFGLTVAEAMWKARPVVGSTVGGIVDQIVDGETGCLVGATDPEAYARAVCTLLGDGPLAKTMGAAGYERVRDEFLGDRHLEQWAHCFERFE
jgi:trehalose synthase